VFQESFLLLLLLLFLDSWIAVVVVVVAMSCFLFYYHEKVGPRPVSFSPSWWMIKPAKVMCFCSFLFCFFVFQVAQSQGVQRFCR
jgi:hypothetical protein